MVSAGKVSGDRSDLKSGLKSAKTALNGIGSSWQGTSHDTLTDQFDNFYSQVKVVLNDMDSFKKAVSLYKEYEEAKKEWKHYKKLFNGCEADDPSRGHYKREKNEAKDEMDKLKKKIIAALNSISGMNDSASSKKNPQLNIFEQSAFGNQLIADIAEKEVGTLEYGGHEKYADYCGLAHSEPWCAAFVSWICNEAGYSNSISPFTWVDYSEIEKQKEKGCDVHYGPLSSEYESPENKNYVPKAGDLIYYDFENNKRLNHVGIVQSADSNSIHTIEGNTSGEEEMAGKGDCVSHKTRSYDTVYAFVTPKK